MVKHKSLDELELIAALLHDAHKRYGDVFNTRSLRNTLNVCIRRYRSEGLSFLTKTLPRLDKHLQQVLAGSCKLNPTSIGFTTIRGTELPRFLGELFSLIFHTDGSVLPNSDANCVRVIRDILGAFYKLKLPYNDVQEQKIIDDFCKAEDDLSNDSTRLAEMRQVYYDYYKNHRLVRMREQNFCVLPRSPEQQMMPIIRGARAALQKLFMHFDPTNITPSHGPGVVSTKERLSRKFLWTNVSSRITDMYPFDAYFCASNGHVCDTFDKFKLIKQEDLPAKVLLVPKDSRGPRLISCEPVDFQWIQQGLSRAIVRLVESHYTTKYNVNFTDQGPNQRGALLGSSTGRYATLDLKEASDRVNLELVRLLFPESILGYLEACRSTSTTLPNGRILKLQKYAPMGSALCFPVLALTIWSILTAAAPDAYTRERILVYGDDVIVPTAFAESAMTVLEFFGLQINRNKSCSKGSFRESCGMDAFQGTCVTPVRLRTVWDESPRPDVYSSYIAYANAYWDRRYYTAYEYIVTRLKAIYGPIPDESMNLSCPSLRVEPAEHGKFKSRYNKHLHKMQYYVRDVSSPTVHQVIDGWSMLLRYFTEVNKPSIDNSVRSSDTVSLRLCEDSVFSVSRYTERRTSMLVRRWR